MSKFNEDRRNNSGAGRYGLSRAQVSYISQCKLIINSAMVYLSLDPYDELSNEIELDNDCLWFKGGNIETA